MSGISLLLLVFLLLGGSAAPYIALARPKLRKAAIALAVCSWLVVILIGVAIFFVQTPVPVPPRQPSAINIAALSPAEENDDKKKPSWVGAQPQSLADAYQTAVVVGPFTTREECESQLPNAIQEAINAYTEICLGERPAGRIALTGGELCGLVKEQWVEVKEYSVGPMVRLHALLRFDLKFKDRLLDEYKRLAISRRLCIAGGGWLAAILVLAAVYLGLKRRIALSPRKWDCPPRAAQTVKRG